MDQLILAEEREERIKKLRVAPRPIKSETNAAGRWSKIPILTNTIIRQNKPVKKTSSRMLAKYHDPLVHESRKVPMTNRITKWSLGLGLILEMISTERPGRASSDEVDAMFHETCSKPDTKTHKRR